MSIASEAKIVDVSAESADSGEQLKPTYLETLNLIERLHRQLLDVIKDELDRIGQADINSVQALLLFNIGEQELTAGELRTRGHYLGSNVSYNLKKLVDAGYIHHARSDLDRRSVRVRLTDQGLKIAQRVDALFGRHVTSLEAVGGLDVPRLDELNDALRRLERYWSDQVRYRL